MDIIEIVDIKTKNRFDSLFDYAKFCYFNGFEGERLFNKYEFEDKTKEVITRLVLCVIDCDIINRYVNR